eukprot:CAMPEP_0195532442 /NCGR_PEP_ID=MMETSP0794_2-20130614/38135_1 /TAXON_ID=515487 /ORGANISM="Stephanopyxis turris, Strain CCMP 815" /LENGTH=309 /DNA_ID=CAMNT_0040664655 /DNA_START=209 /DNA_END=1138 /DNA_ORIENTATION=+
MQNFIAWSPLTPNTFDEDDITLDGCQIAKDKEYLGAILKQWNAEERSLEVETQPYEYKDDEGNLFGRLVRRTKSEEADKNSLPGILLFHTGAGPLDVSLFYKAESLAQKFDCVVLICDIVSDCYGWGWREDRTHMSEIQDSLMADDASFLRLRATSAAEALSSVPEVDPQRLAAIGWCLGGQPILELGRVKSAAYSIRAMATFHGVFQRDELAPVLTDESPSSESASGGTVLICNGKDDPFVSAKDLEDSKNCFEANGWTVDLQQYEGAKHGFSNPAQEFNKDPAFGYNEEVATKSWDATLQLLEKQLF